MKNRILFGTTIALCSALVSVPAIAQTAMLKIIRASDANVQGGQRVGAGQIVRTNPARVSGGKFYRGGEVEASLLEWGLKRVILSKRSSVQVRSFGFCFGGGRVLELQVTGEAFLTTRQLTHRCSDIRVCFGERNKGCGSLRSSIKVKRLDDGESYSVAVQEGQVSAQDYDRKTESVEIAPDHFSMMNRDGAFSIPQLVDRNNGYRVVTRTRSVIVLQSLPGYSLFANGQTGNRFQLPIGVPYNVITPLD
jgi:hypothetical protein